MRRKMSGVGDALTVRATSSGGDSRRQVDGQATRPKPATRQTESTPTRELTRSDPTGLSQALACFSRVSRVWWLEIPTRHCQRVRHRPEIRVAEIITFDTATLYRGR